MRTDDLSREPRAAEWIKSSHSGPDGGNCVEVARLPDAGRAVRDSKNPAGEALVVTPSEWSAFVNGVKAGTPSSAA
ncbi:toxin [Sphaerisporangium melleum]|uniref:Toxin n=1 Tax=Sphaerisporangium melleum TaxID=321316 RepID=A0A917RJF9_9ACTN|nr:DUF397 domain-containing protein [Sphaerisporangium melleum]GGL10834.1 toxin [Sphaerisporangium melleum]GII69096.1 toxin [Sphaerisporangium melleum]